MIDAARLSGTWAAADSRSVGLITTTRNAHIIVIFIKHPARTRLVSGCLGEENVTSRHPISDETLVIVNNRNRD